MRGILKEKLWSHIVRNNPEIAISLQEKQSVDAYLEAMMATVAPTIERLLNEGAPVYIIEEICLDALTGELGPSRYQYVLPVLEEEFPEDYERLKRTGILAYEVVNMMMACKSIFDEFGFSAENEDDRFLRYAIIGQIHDYLG